MFFVTIAAVIWRKRWIDVMAAVGMAALWGYYFIDLQSALK
jgi:hypothetical protein